LIGPYLFRNKALTTKSITERLKEAGYEFSLSYVMLVDQMKTAPSYRFLKAMKMTFGEDIDICHYFLEDKRIWNFEQKS